MYLDIYFRPDEQVARTDVEEAFQERLPHGCEIVGAGIGQIGSNIDLEIPDRSVVGQVTAVLRSLGVSPDTELAFSDTFERRRLSEWPEWPASRLGKAMHTGRFRG